MHGVLFVDDEIFALQFIKTKLTHVDFACYYAQSGKQALEILKNHEDIVLLVTDINMDDMDGFALLKNVRRDYPDIKRIVLSAHKGPYMIKQAIEEGDIHEFLPKPIDIETQLLPILQSILKFI